MSGRPNRGLSGGTENLGKDGAAGRPTPHRAPALFTGTSASPMPTGIRRQQKFKAVCFTYAIRDKADSIAVHELNTGSAPELCGCALEEALANRVQKGEMDHSGHSQAYETARLLKAMRK